MKICDLKIETKVCTTNDYHTTTLSLVITTRITSKIKITCFIVRFFSKKICAKFAQFV